YLGYYGLTRDFVEIKIENILVAATALFSFIFFLLMLYYLVWRIWPKNKAIKMNYVWMFVALFVVVSDHYPDNEFDAGWYVYAALFAWLIIMEMLLPMYLRRKEEKKEDQATVEKEEIKNEPVDKDLELITWIVKIVDPYVVVVLLLVLFLGNIAGIVGKGDAEKKLEYYLPSDNENMAIVRIYEDKMIGVMFDADSKEVQKHTFIKNVGADEQIELTNEKIGPLVPSK
ncbi:MAG: hypothetical protein ACYC1E_17885, partial [Propionibacteriaceae bacterium]